MSINIVDFADKMASNFDVKIIQKSQFSSFRSFFRKYVLRQAEQYIPDMDEIYRPCCVKVFRWYFIYLNFDLDDRSISDSDKMKIITHECQHAADIRQYIIKTGKKGANWFRNYFTDDTFRAWAEGTPNTAESELEYFITGKYPDPICDYSAYLIRDVGAKRLFEDGCEVRKLSVIRQGQLWTATQKASRKAIQILEAKK